MEENIKFERTVGETNGVLFVTIPLELRNYLGVEKGDTMIIVGQNKNKGKFLAVWKKE